MGVADDHHSIVRDHGRHIESRGEIRHIGIVTAKLIEVKVDGADVKVSLYEQTDRFVAEEGVFGLEEVIAAELPSR